MLQCLNPIKTALDKVQGNNVLVSDAVYAWKTVMNEFRTAERRDWLEQCEKRYANAVPDSWFAVCLIDPRSFGSDLTEFEKNRGLEWVRQHHPDSYSAVFEIIGMNPTEQIAKFNELQSVSPSTFLKSQVALGKLPSTILPLMDVLFALVPSTAAMERAFSTMGLIHSEIRNRLSPVKVKKLAFIIRALRQNNS